MIDRHLMLPGIPLIEAPFANMVENASGLRQDDHPVAMALHHNGFAVIDFPDPDIMNRIDRVKARLAPMMDIDPDDGNSIKVGDKRIQDAWTFDEDVRAIAANPDMLALLGRLYGRPAFPFQTLNFPVGTQQPLHTDAVHFSSLPERFMCGVWLAMEDISEAAGPLAYVPGSHRWPIMMNLTIGRRGFGSTLESAQRPFEDAWRIMAEASGVQTETFLARKGQALIWCANLLHGGSVQTEPTLTRWSQVTHYFFDDCIYYTPAFSDEAVGKLDIRSILDIRDGSPRPGHFLGEDVQPKPAPAPRNRSWLRRTKRLLGL